MTPTSDRGFTLIELLIVVAIISIIAAIAVPGLLRSKMTGNETSAVGSLRAVIAAQVSYSTACGGGAYAASFPVLYAPPGGSGQGFIGADLGLQANPKKSGYDFAMVPGLNGNPGSPDCNGTPTATGFYATGVPQAFGTMGTRSFATDTGGTIWYLSQATPPTQPFGAPAATIQ